MTVIAFILLPFEDLIRERREGSETFVRRGYTSQASRKPLSACDMFVTVSWVRHLLCGTGCVAAKNDLPSLFPSRVTESQWVSERLSGRCCTNVALLFSRSQNRKWGRKQNMFADGDRDSWKVAFTCERQKQGPNLWCRKCFLRHMHTSCMYTRSLFESFSHWNHPDSFHSSSKGEIVEGFHFTDWMKSEDAHSMLFHSLEIKRSWRIKIHSLHDCYSLTTDGYIFTANICLRIACHSIRVFNFHTVSQLKFPDLLISWSRILEHEN